MQVEPVPDIPALELKGVRKWVCVADLHIGIEVQLRAAGFNIPSQMPKMLNALEELASHGDRLLILGDVKHRIPSVGFREDREIKGLLDKLDSHYDEVMIAAGNHDGGLTSILPEDVKSISSHGGKFEDIGFFHGHVWPSKEAMDSNKLLMAHMHPSVQFTDSIGSRMNEKCWVRAGFREDAVKQRYASFPAEIVVLPAFNPLLTGTPINTRSGQYMGPLFRNGLVDESTMKLYLLDGTDLGHTWKK